MAAKPIDAGTFDACMQALGPFESAPHIAVAVSGGADSLCLALLTQQWTGAMGGRMSGLVVDHGLRPEAADEAAGVATQLHDRGIDAHVLTWTGVKPHRNVQATARAARYDLLLAWCRAHHVIHLAVAHHALDQAETYLMRQRAGSGLDGLAGIAGITERRGVRIIRPLLDLTPQRLRATLRSAELPWIEDPSNRDERYTRVRIRQEVRSKNKMARFSKARRTAAVRRHAAEQDDANFLASAARLSALGYATLDLAAFLRLSPEAGRRCLSHVLRCIGALDYAPRTARLETLRRHAASDRATEPRTLGGCLVMRRCPNTLLICREPAATDQAIRLEKNRELYWDRRFRLRIEPSERSKGPLSVRRLDDAAWGTLRKRFPSVAKALSNDGGPFGLPAPARSSLPMLCDLDGPCALPHLPNQSTRLPDEPHALEISFRPRAPLAGASFAVGGT